MGLRISSVDSKTPRVALTILALFLSLHIFYLLFRDPPARFIPNVSPASPPDPLPTAHPAISRVKTPFPRKVWQTSKRGPASFDESDIASIKTWTKLNQKWRYESVTQYSAESYVRSVFVDRPDIIETFTDLQDPILRADMIRYLVLLGDGGMYSDIDTRALKPIDDWIPTEFQAEANLVVGVEYDKLDGNRWGDWTLDLQFSTWAILAKPKHPAMERTVQKVVKALNSLALKQSTTLAGIKPNFDEVLDTTGPAMFTNSIFEHLTIETGRNFTWLNVTNLKAPRLVEDILILPITAFGCGQAHSNSRDAEDDEALVQHLFKGSWKNDHPKDEPQDQKPQEEQKEEPQIEIKEEEEQQIPEWLVPQPEESKADESVGNPFLDLKHNGNGQTNKSENKTEEKAQADQKKEENKEHKDKPAKDQAKGKDQKPKSQNKDQKSQEKGEEHKEAKDGNQQQSQEGEKPDSLKNQPRVSEDKEKAQETKEKQ